MSNPDVDATTGLADAERSTVLATEREARVAAEAAAYRLGQLQAVTEAFAAALTPDRVFDVVVAQAVGATGADAGSVCLLDDDGMIRVRRWVGYPDEVLRRFGTLALDAPVPIAEAVRTGDAVYLPDMAKVPARFEAVAEVVAGTGRAAAALPLLTAGDPIGALSLRFGERQPFDRAQRAFLAAVAQQCAAALERASLWQAARRARERLTFLVEASSVAGSSLERDVILERLTRLAVPRLADVAAAYLPQGSVLRLVALAHPDPDAEASLRELVERNPARLDGDQPSAAALRTGTPQLLRALDPAVLGTLEPEVREMVDRLGVHGGIVVPIKARGSVLGVMSFALTDPGRRHSDNDLAMAAELATRAGMALENAAMYEREHSVAESLQRAVLPESLPVLDGHDLAAEYLPASPGADIGGDWYDAFVLRDGRVGLAIGDVVGHGLRAAAAMGQLRNALRAYAMEGESPAAVLTRLNQLLVESGSEHFATAVYAVYEPATGSLRWANAGHPGPFRQGVEPGFLAHPSSTVLGVMEDPGYADGVTVLAPGELLLFYTDGLIERRGEHLDISMGRLAGVVAATAATGVDPAGLCVEVVDAMFGDCQRDDDICLLALRRR
jgi:serine phosphatase RsbU (regulator of sigma subunit)